MLPDVVNLAKKLALITSIGVGCTLFYKYVSWKKEEVHYPTADVDVEPASSSDLPKELFGTRPEPDHTFEGNPWNKDKGFIHLGKCSNVDESVLQKRISRNLCYVTVLYNNKYHSQHLLGVYDQYALGTWHLLELMRNPEAELSIIYLRNQFGKNEVVIHHRMKGSPKVVERIGPDIGLIRLTNVNAFKDIREHLCKNFTFEGEFYNVQGDFYYISKFDFLGKKNRVF